MSHRQSVSHQVQTSHSQLHQNDSLSQESSGNDTVRVKRHNYQLLRFFGIHVIPSTPPTTTVTPWVEAYNETHNIVQNYTFRHIVRATEERENATSLGYSKDLHFWHTEKYSRCHTYKEILDECSRNNLTSPTSVKVTSPLEIVKTEKSLIKDLTDNLTVEKCDSIRSLMSLCHSENIFPEKHIDLSGLWQSVNHTKFNESELYNTVNLLQSLNQTEERLISGIAKVDIPFLSSGNDTGVSGSRNDSNSSTNSLP